MSSSGIVSNGYAVALDVGDVRIGVAITSLIAKLPAPLMTVSRSDDFNPGQWISDLVKDNSVSVIVVGLPRDINGNETEQTLKARQFAELIESGVNIPVVMQEEAVTSINAEDRLKAKGRPYSKADIDAESACIILQDYLNGQPGSTA